MKKFLAFALLTIGLILNASAGVPTAVPDPGSTALLLGLGLAAIAAYRRKTN